MHLVDVEHGVMGASAVVGSTIPLAVGYAYALKHRRSNAVVVSIFGDGAVEEGVWHESLNFAALKQLPVIFICENNLYAIFTHQLRRQRTANICDRARVYGMPAEQIGDDVIAMTMKIGAAVERLRAGHPGPFFFECLTYRWKEHVGPGEDFHFGHRSREEAEPWLANDQVRHLESLVGSQAPRIQSEVDAEIRDAFEAAERSPFPVRDELFTDVFKDA
jgi:TPP-dependent pyruvate/acetoin dehydrogenase alpha subunit